MTEIGITAFGGYIPRLRMRRESIVKANAWVNPGLMAYGRSERSMCDYDEDSITMAVEAGRDCLSGLDRREVEALYFASTTMPFDDRQNSSVVAEGLNLKEAITSLDVSHSQRAGSSGLIVALRGVRGGNGGTTIFVAADQRMTRAGSTKELLYGDGAAALALGSNNLAAKFLGSYSINRDLVGHFRVRGEKYDYEWEERWIRQEGFFKIVPLAIEGLLEQTGVGAAEIDHFVMPCVIRGVRESIAKMIGIVPEAIRDDLFSGCGETGTAHPVVMLVDALQDAVPGQKILVIGFGQGADALLFETTEELRDLPERKGIKGTIAEMITEDSYQKFLSFRSAVDMTWGIEDDPGPKRARLTTLYRNRKLLNSLIGGRCATCGTFQLPAAHICINPACRAVDSQEDYSFSDSAAKIATFTVDWLTATPNPPLLFGMVEFEEGAKLMTPFTGCKAEDVKVGLAMEMVFRIKDIDQRNGFRNYFWKAAPKMNCEE